MDRLLVEIVDDVGSAEEGVAEDGELCGLVRTAVYECPSVKQQLTILKGAEKTDILINRALPHKLIIRHLDRQIPKSKVHHSALPLILTVNLIKPIRRSLGIRERREQLAEDLGRQSREGIPTVDEHDLAVAVLRVEDRDGIVVAVVDGYAVEGDPPAGGGLGGVGWGHDGEFL